MYRYEWDWYEIYELDNGVSEEGLSWFTVRLLEIRKEKSEVGA